jgi:predicted enzyme related to lactoylglutathione lyase
MKRVTCIGGIFFKSEDPKALGTWYREHLGVDVQEWGGVTFDWKSPDNPQGAGTTTWSLFPADSTHFAPSTAPFMINYRVDDLHALLATLRAEGVHVEEKVEESEFGKFGWAIDPEGNKFELWQPPARQ